MSPQPKILNLEAYLQRDNLKAQRQNQDAVQTLATGEVNL